MPKSNGFQVCRTIRQQLQPTKIIVVSGRDYAVDRASAFEAGADEYLLKPITLEILCDAIDRLLPAIPRRPGATKSSEELAWVPPRLKLWGVRGSLPVPGLATVRYGGNTSCVEVRADGEIIVLDAGTGIRGLGFALEKELGPQTIKLTLLITHTHWDHIQGLPFFSPAYNPKNQIRILGYEGARAGLATILAGQMETPFFPVSLRELPSHLAIEELKEMEFHIAKVKVQAKFANHPGICAGYRLFTSAGSIAYMPDNEPYSRSQPVSLSLTSYDKQIACIVTNASITAVITSNSHATSDNYSQQLLLWAYVWSPRFCPRPFNSSTSFAGYAPSKTSEPRKKNSYQSRNNNAFTAFILIAARPPR